MKFWLLTTLIFFAQATAHAREAVDPQTGAGESVQTEQTQAVQTYLIEPGGAIRVENILGDITIEAWGGSEVRVAYLVTGGSVDAAEQVSVLVDSQSDTLWIGTRYRDGQNPDTTDQRATVHISLKVPSTINLPRVATVSGTVTIGGVIGEIEAAVTDGIIRAKGLQSGARLYNENGPVEAEFVRLDRNQRVIMESVSGDIIASLPVNADVAVRAESSYGLLRNEFGLGIEKGLVGRIMRGDIAGGDASLSVKTVHGSIQLLRMGGVAAADSRPPPQFQERPGVSPRPVWDLCFKKLGIVEGGPYLGLASGEPCAACVNHFWAGNEASAGVRQCARHDGCEKADELARCLLDNT